MPRLDTGGNVVRARLASLEDSMSNYGTVQRNGSHGENEQTYMYCALSADVGCSCSACSGFVLVVLEVEERLLTTLLNVTCIQSKHSINTAEI